MATERFFTGIGSRDTPEQIGTLMTAIARVWCDRGWVLRSGGSPGADTFFETGVDPNDHPPPEIFIPFPGFNKRDRGIYEPNLPEWFAAAKIASDIHPVWSALSEIERAFHTRNIFQVLGRTLDRPSEFVVYWAPERDGEIEGGTRTAVMLARSRNIPTFNLLNPLVRTIFELKAAME